MKFDFKPKWSSRTSQIHNQGKFFQWVACFWQGKCKHTHTLQQTNMKYTCSHWLSFLRFLLFSFSNITYFETYLLHLCLLSGPKIEILLIQNLIQTILIGMLSSLRLNFPSRKNLSNECFIHDQLCSVTWIQNICLFLQKVKYCWSLV